VKEASMTFEEVSENFSILEDWEDRYRYLIEMGRSLAPLAAEERTPETKVRGCASQVWLVSHVNGRGPDATIDFRGDSDAHIVRGLIAIIIVLFSGKSAAQILETDAKKAFAQLGLVEHLTPQRSNGLASMVNRIKHDAAAAAAEHRERL
jgi:cysteine desulfuration protein SufE